MTFTCAIITFDPVRFSSINSNVVEKPYKCHFKTCGQRNVCAKYNLIDYDYILCTTQLVLHWHILAIMLTYLKFCKWHYEVLTSSVHGT